MVLFLSVILRTERDFMTVHSVSDVTRYIKGMFEGEAILSDLLIRGEVSNFKRYPSGHCYFTLKDAGASMKCVMFNGYARSLRFTPENGMQVIAGGSIDIRGTCRGIVHAGAYGDRDAIIIADHLMPVQIRIADVIAQSPEQYEKPELAERASVQDGRIVIEPIER